MVEFVNPYTFLPLPETVCRERPQGHDGSGAQQLFSGRIETEWSLQTELLLPQGEAEAEWLTVGRDGRGRLCVPGSSVKGALRSLHEAVFNGCLSVLDEDFIPVYREPVSVGLRTERARLAAMGEARGGEGQSDEQWVIGVITEVDESGRPRGIKTCKAASLCWLDSEAVQGLYSDRQLPANGDVVRVDGNPSGRGRQELRSFTGRVESRVQDRSGPYDGEGRVLLITDTNARHREHRWFWASAEINVRMPALRLSDEVWEIFLARAEGSEDLRRIRAGDEQDRRLQKVARDGHPLGMRLVHRGRFLPGDALWVRVDRTPTGGFAVVDLSYSAIWRHLARRDGRTVRLGDLFGEVDPAASLHSCDPASEAGLCLSCSIFGCVGREHKKGEEGGGYAGHVRIGGLRSPSEAETEEEARFAPLLAPRPGNGQFYLRNRKGVDQKTGTAPEGDIRSRWDSEMRTQPRPAGRKFYWNHEPRRRVRGRPRSRAWDGAGEGVVGPRRMVKPREGGTPLRLRGTVHFEQLTAVQLLSLLAVLHPELLLRLYGVEAIPGGPVIRIGGGKPLGFGAVRPRIRSLRMQASADRYTGSEPAREISLDEALARLLEGGGTARAGELIARRVQPSGTAEDGVGRNVRRLRRLMDPDGLDTDVDKVAYPPGAEWSRFGSKPFHESFTFFAKTHGEGFRNREGHWTPLPEIDAKNQRIEWKPPRDHN